MKWKTVRTVIDKETGELITQRHVQKGKYIVVKIVQVNKKITNDYGEKQIKWLCEKNRQYELKLETTNRESGNTRHTIHSNQSGREVVSNDGEIQIE